jgi:divalent metal cation (Fe/Co/Zn/Cd) transporter
LIRVSERFRRLQIIVSLALVAVGVLLMVRSLTAQASEETSMSMVLGIVAIAYGLMRILLLYRRQR